jgi:hypothetical protein
VLFWREGNVLRVHLLASGLLLTGKA